MSHSTTELNRAKIFKNTSFKKTARKMSLKLLLFFLFIYLTPYGALFLAVVGYFKSVF